MIIMKTIGLILLGGKGNRLKNDIPKQFIKVNDKMICEYSLDVFSKSELIDEICISYIDGYEDIYSYLLSKYKKIKYKVKGGSERQYSIYNALVELENKNFETIVIHDSARPFVTVEEIDSVIFSSKRYGAATTVLPVVDTIKICADNIVQKTLDRTLLYSVKTPQAFDFNTIFDAHNIALKDDFLGTDDCSLVERLNKKVHTVKANDNNIKITTNIDLIIMKAILKGEK